MAHSLSRRSLLKAGAAAGAASFLPPSRGAAAAAPPPRGGLDAIEHVVLLMQENRSFDHYFGTLRGVCGFGDRTAIRLRGGASIFEQPAAGGGAVLPFGVREAAERGDKNIQYIGDLPHGWPDGIAAWADGWYDGWIPAKSPATMAYYDRRDLPLQYELADTFTICDHYFCSVRSSTSPNRNCLVSGYTGFEPGSTDRAVTNAAYDEDRHAGYDWITYPELLEREGISWQTYQEWDNFGDNNLEFFARFKAIMAKALAPVDGGRHRNLTSFYGSLPDRPAADQERLLAALDASVETLLDGERSLFERGLRRRRPESLVPAFAADVAAGKLPAVSHLVASAADSEHPGSSSPIQSAHITYDVLDALASHPDVWRKTAVFITYDEFDGLFDHVPPPVAPPEVQDERFQGQPIGPGARVPMIVVSPWSVGGFVCSEVFDHASMTLFLERWTGVRAPDISDWRRRVCGDLTSAFDFRRRTALPVPEQPSEVPPFTGRWHPEPPAQQALPAQEPGARPARPLPYGTEASARVRAGQLRLTLRNEGERSAPMAVYGYDGSTEAPVHVDVARRKRIALTPGGPAYDVIVTGPNRFRRDFAGSLPGAALDVVSEASGYGRRLRVTLTNRGRATLDVEVTPLAYGGRVRRLRIRPGAERVVSWETEEGWYDVEVTVDQEPAYRRRLTGHVENGRPSVSG